MGSHLMAEAGYDPMQLARLFEKLNAQGNSGLQFLSDHPNPDNRERAIEQEAQRLPQQVYSYQTGDFQRIKRVVATIKEPAPPAMARQ
jgi:predicted Zn-dependent protease